MKLSLLLTGIVIIFLFLMAGSYISPQDKLQKADAIVAVSGGDTAARTLEAVRLHQQKWAPLLIFSGAAEDPGSQSNAMAMRSIAISKGVPPDVIAIDEYSKNTEENANEVSAIIDALDSKKVILVTSPYHQRRASLEFRKRLQGDAEIINHSAPDETWSRQRWWLSQDGWSLTLSEFPKTLVTEVTSRLPF